MSADVAELLTAFRVELITAGLVRRPSDAGVLPPMHVSPIGGPPAPGEREGIENDDELVLSLLYSTDVAPATSYDAALSKRSVLDVRFRSSSNEARRRAFALDAAITTTLISPGTNYGYGFDLGGLRVLEVLPAGGGPIWSDRDTGFDDVSKWLVEVGR